MSDSTQKPTITDICKIAFESNGFNFFSMNKEFNLVNHRFRFMICHYNAKTKKSHFIFFNNKRVMINFAYKKGYTSCNACQINKKTYCFKKNFISNVYHQGNVLTNNDYLKYTLEDA